MKNRTIWRVGAVTGLVAAAATVFVASSAARPSGSAVPTAGAVSGSLVADGSSTVAPFVQAAAEGFRRGNRGANITVGVSGTGGGFEKFCKGETDLQNASRPIRYSEAANCQKAGVRYIQFLVANDGISIVVSRQNTWARCLTADELRKIWDRGSRVNNWSDVRAGFPDVPLKLYGPGTDSGTFEFFTEKINGRARQSRSDYTPSENDNVLVSGVAGERGGMGYFGLSYYLENRNRLNVVQVNGGNGCVTPSVRSVQSRRYRPLARGLFVYVKRDSFSRPVVKAFIRYMIADEGKIARAAKMVPLTKKQLNKAKRQYNTAIGNA